MIPPVPPEPPVPTMDFTVSTSYSNTKVIAILPCENYTVITNGQSWRAKINSVTEAVINVPVTDYTRFVVRAVNYNNAVTDIYDSSYNFAAVDNIGFNDSQGGTRYYFNEADGTTLTMTLNDVGSAGSNRYSQE